jgi:hypothetical protein
MRLGPNGSYVRYTVSIGRGTTRYVHGLVLEAFVGPRPDGMEALHADDNTANNALSNLSWGTREANNAKIDGTTVRSIRLDRVGGMTHQAIADRYGVSRPLISMILGGKRRTAVA